MCLKNSLRKEHHIILMMRIVSFLCSGSDYLRLILVQFMPQTSAWLVRRPAAVTKRTILQGWLPRISKRLASTRKDSDEETSTTPNSFFFCSEWYSLPPSRLLYRALCIVFNNPHVIIFIFTCCILRLLSFIPV